MTLIGVLTSCSREDPAWPMHMISVAHNNGIGNIPNGYMMTKMLRAMGYHI